MFRKVFVLVMVFGFCVCSASAAQISVSWDGEGDGESWSDPYNWDPNIVPDNDGDTFVVTIDSDSIGIDEVEVFLAQDRTVDRLDCFGEVGLEPQMPFRVRLSLTDPNGLTNHGDLSLSGEAQQIEIGGNVTNGEEATLELYLNEIHGDLYNNQEGTIEVEAENDVEGDLRNEGTLTIPHASDLLVDGGIYNGGTIKLYDGECSADVFDNDDSGIIQNFGVLYASQLRNKGQIIASGGSFAISLHLNVPGGINNQGMIQVHAGGVGVGGNVVNDPNGEIELLGGALVTAGSIVESADASFSGFGQITVLDDILIEPDGLIELTGPTNIVGDVNVPADATLRISDGQTLITGHTTCEGTIHLVGGTVVFQGGCDCNECNIINEAGIDRNHFDVNADGAVNLEDYAYFVASWLWESSWY
jgi:hypothetical protein